MSMTRGSPLVTAPKAHVQAFQTTARNYWASQRDHDLAHNDDNLGLGEGTSTAALLMEGWERVVAGTAPAVDMEDVDEDLMQRIIVVKRPKKIAPR
ncbi:hypothetical protein HGRIS_006178 [Hohenbuehelia grisea]|uniref:Uncharacterized protein n=1 Tax=Hohenbuehelia grisea TaxID=104357 RepID=A0ABR3K1H6_9AGAR